MALTPKQRAFAVEYVKDRNGAQAAIRAGYSPTGANARGAYLLANRSIAEEIQKLTAEIEERSMITAVRIRQEYAKIAFFDPRKLYDESGNLKPIGDLDDDTAAAITGIDVVTVGNSIMGVGEVRKVRFDQKKGALDSLARHLGMFNDRFALDVSEELKELLALIAGAGADALSRARKKAGAGGADAGGDDDD
ncbi:MAG: terminase small subunit [Candidatus Competibacteraceae bacterium]|nr:terminase small subunit [Candidatus Competibacteraceae bacterium]